PRILLSSNDPPTTEIYTLSLHDALPICRREPDARGQDHAGRVHLAGDEQARVGRVELDAEERRPVLLRHGQPERRAAGVRAAGRSEEHTSELQSRFDLVCRLLLEKKKKN